MPRQKKPITLYLFATGRYTDDVPGYHVGRRRPTFEPWTEYQWETNQEKEVGKDVTPSVFEASIEVCERQARLAFGRLPKVGEYVELTVRRANSRKRAVRR
jgi:hypothetical protein